VLAALGHEVQIANDGAEALDAARAFQPEIMIIDLGMPGLTGYEVAERLRQEPATREAKLVALSGYGGEDTARRCRAAGFDRHLTKPLTEDALQALLNG
jgi:two-component system CheB/CheR fusion protein